jgi:hypothetical protein
VAFPDLGRGRITLFAMTGSPDDVLRLRAAGQTYAQIAAELGYASASAAAADGKRALKASKALLGRQSGELTTLELERLDALEQAAWEVLRARHLTISEGRVVRDDDGQVVEDDAPVLQAIDRLVRISEVRSRLIAANRAPGTVEAAVRRELATLSAKVRDGAQAHAAIMLAVSLDAGMPPRDAAAVSRELRVSMATLAAMSPERAEGDPIDELTARREARLTADR